MTQIPDGLRTLAERYARFAEVEARGSSPIYETLALAVSRSVELLEFVAALPQERRQPNLFLAAVRKVAGVARDGDHLIELVRRHGSAIGDVMLARTTQTNEPARCAVLLPALARLPQPLALIEVGASAGLCLLPDRYGYDYGRTRVLSPAQADGRTVVFSCEASDTTPLPTELPSIAWRRGVDLAPLDLHLQEDMEWLEILVWPDQEERARRLRWAIAVARADPPIVVKGDLLEDLPALAASAPRHATLVIFHTAALGYVARQADRERFVTMVRDLGAVWLSNEPPRVFPAIAAQAPPAPMAGLFLLAQDGKPLAWTGPHGQSIHWIAP
jgi:hypothetical protein